jgi:SAM-dependent methyltransferase
MKKKSTVDIKAILKKNNLGIKLDIGCGANKQVGFVGMDIRQLPGVDIVQDLETFPWSLPSESVSFAVASHVVEHINPAKGIFLNFMDEVWRIIQPGGQFAIVVPYAGSPGYWQDPTHCNGCIPATFTYFDPLAKRPDGSGQLIGLYTIYEPAPWRIVTCTFDIVGNLEVALEKRVDIPEYHADRTIHYKK